MNKNQYYKRLILQNQIEDCRRIIVNSTNGRKTILLNNKQKEMFFELGTLFTAFLTKQDDKTHVKDLAKILSIPNATISRLFFEKDYLGFNKKKVLDALDSIERVSDEKFATLEEAEAKEKEVVC
ncbi:hypothetical protein [Staphylococcus warneri]|uniref:hypothetical protein n=1 Tax=Staphylococcus warneri TaxID=1292 RepID=UPI000737A500|nr:hypothetical protein [Staphylococcus warneri]KTW21474.1 hypothetical protein SA10R_09845 [Staphylococcus warneri]